MDQLKVDQLVLELGEASGESAACALHEMGSVVIPDLQRKFASVDEPRVRQAIVEIIDQFRRCEDLPFFASALLDIDERVWQAAIDALASQPCQESLRLAQRILQQVEAEGNLNRKKLLFLREAVAELQQPNPFSVGKKGFNNV